MVAWQESTRKLTAVIGSTVDKKDSSVAITFEDSAQKKTGVLFSISIIPATICLLAARLDELVGHIDHQDRPEMQTLQCSALDFSMNEAGQVALLIGLQGGGNLPIQFEREQLAILRTHLEEALAATDPKARH